MGYAGAIALFWMGAIAVNLIPQVVRRLWRARPMAVKKMGTPGEIPKKVPSDRRQHLIRNLEQRGLVKIQKTQLKEVWLTPVGERYLREDCEPDGGQSRCSVFLCWGRTCG